LRGTSVAFAEKVFMSEKRAWKLRVSHAYVNLLSAAVVNNASVVRSTADKNTSWRLARPPYNL
jgi:hypothetical protein